MQIHMESTLPSELALYLLTVPCESIGSGSYNHAIKTKSQIMINGVMTHWVIKWPVASNDLDNQLNDPYRAVRKLRAIHPDMPAYVINGYRLKLMFNSNRSNLPLCPGILYVSYSSTSGLEASFINALGVMVCVSLNGMDTKEDIVREFEKIERSNAHTRLSPEAENRIFYALQCPRLALVMPYFGNTKTNDDEISMSLINIYRYTRYIVLDACAKNNVLSYGAQKILVDVDCVVHRASPISMLYYYGDQEKQAVYRQFWRHYSSAGFPQSVNTIRTLLYLEEHLRPEEIIGAYITAEVLDYLYKFMNQKIPLDVRTVDMVVMILNTCAVRGVLNPTFSVDFVLMLKDRPMDAEVLLESFVIGALEQQRLLSTSLSDTAWMTPFVLSIEEEERNLDFESFVPEGVSSRRRQKMSPLRVDELIKSSIFRPIVAEAKTSASSVPVRASLGVI